MITLDDFLGLVTNVLTRRLNEAQRESVCHDGEESLLVVAGPGSGKTTVLVLRALRHVFVDDRLPEQILITTFTKKAAKELRTRWLDWGSSIFEHLHQRGGLENRLQQIDLNRCRIDTLDSIAQQAISDNKLPGDIAQVVIEDSTASLVLKRRAFSAVYSQNKSIINPLLARYSFDGKEPVNTGSALQLVKLLCDRFVQDQVDLSSYASRGHAHTLIVGMARSYWQHLSDSGLLDFATLESLFLERMRNGTLHSWLSDISTLMIDEYQDTNPLQESIYFELISQAASRVTVVGDDDQAMYRFRGGSVELFTKFASRCYQVTGRSTRRVDMVTNYRSSNEIVEFYNSHIRGDSGFSGARINPAKPEVVADRGAVDFPVLGLFRETPDDLAESLASWLDRLLTTRSFVFEYRGAQRELTLGQQGALGDAVLLGHTVDEEKYQGFGAGAAELKFPGMLRASLERLGHPVFNPRGRSLRAIPAVQMLLGLVLLCLDPTGRLTSQAGDFFVTNEARYYLDLWRRMGEVLLSRDPVSASNSRLADFVSGWQSASTGAAPFEENDWPVLELLFKLITWIPDFQNDPEHQVWLEAVTRVFSSGAIESAYRMQIHQNDPHRDRSRQVLVRDGLLPIAQNDVAVDEEIMPSVPRDRLQLMTIHQSKGLEFPLVIVDVGSGFTSNHHTQAFRRFPRKESNVTVLEDDIEGCLIAPLRSGRSAIDRSFDDLVRLYYVAYSRPQSVLLLIGCEKCLNYGSGRNLSGAIPHIGLGWHRDGTWPWRQPRPGRGGAPVLVDTPFKNITL